MLELKDLIDFSIHSWYEKFKNIALKTVLLEIPSELLEKLKCGDSDFDIKEICSSDFVESIKNAINELNRSAFVKNNWHAPMDTKMFSLNNQLIISNLADLILHLSISNIISEDFSSHSGIPFVIAMKPWKNIHPATEFRCIVINNILRAITPRDWPVYYAHFKEEGPEIISTVTNFYTENIQTRFPRQTYTFDVVIPHTDSPYLLDFGPLNQKTTLYAFAWKEIAPLLNEEAPEDVAPTFRYLEDDIGIMTRGNAIMKFANSFT